MNADLISLLEAQREWSLETFGPGTRLGGILAHIRKELVEVEENPTDPTEWIDVVILAFDGAWRQGWDPSEIVAALNSKYAKNRDRTWPDWRTAPEGEAIEHVREEWERIADEARFDAARLPDPVCVECGRDNKNRTHDALERIGHLAHSFDTLPKAVR